MYNNNISYRILAIEEREIWALEDVKNYLRVVHKNDDKLITGLINSAIITAEQFLALSFFIKKIICVIDRTPNYLILKYLPISSVTGVFLVTGEDKKDITEDFGHVDPNNQKIWFNQKYLHRKIQVNYDAGLGDKIPKTILHGILMHVGMMYDFGENSVNILSEVKDIYMPYRVLKV